MSLRCTRCVVDAAEESIVEDIYATLLSDDKQLHVDGRFGTISPVVVGQDHVLLVRRSTQGILEVALLRMESDYLDDFFSKDNNHDYGIIYTSALPMGEVYVVRPSDIRAVPRPGCTCALRVPPSFLAWRMWTHVLQRKDARLQPDEFANVTMAASSMMKGNASIQSCEK